MKKFLMISVYVCLGCFFLISFSSPTNASIPVPAEDTGGCDCINICCSWGCTIVDCPNCENQTVDVCRRNGETNEDGCTSACCPHCGYTENCTGEAPTE